MITEDQIIAEKDGSFTINVEGGTVTTEFKELTNQEIFLIWHKVWYEKDETILEFARAILRKAQEK
jgi:hypothetical protein